MNRNKKDFDVLCVGLAVCDILVSPFPEEFEGGDVMQVNKIDIMCGGDAFNQASVLAALGHKVKIISKVASDTKGELVLETLKSRNIDTSKVAIDTQLGTSSCIVMVYPDGQRKFCTFKGCLKTFGMSDIDFESVEQAKIVSIGGLYSMPSFDQEASVELFRRAKKAEAKTVLDTKYDAFHIGINGIKNLLEYTDYFFPSYQEASYLSERKKPEEIVRFFAERGAKNIGVKLGGEGCYLYTKEYEGIIPAFHTKVLDTTGAGDNFMAGLIHGILNEWNLVDSVIYANGAGARAVSQYGATNDEEYPDNIKKILMQTIQGERLIKEVIKS